MNSLTAASSQYNCGILNTSDSACYISSAIQLICHGMPDVSESVVNFYQNMPFDMRLDKQTDECLHAHAFMAELSELFRVLRPSQLVEHFSASSSVSPSSSFSASPSEHVNPNRFYEALRQGSPSLNSNAMGDVSVALRVIVQRIQDSIEVLTRNKEYFEGSTEHHDSALRNGEILRSRICGKMEKKLMGQLHYDCILEEKDEEDDEVEDGDEEDDSDVTEDSLDSMEEISKGLETSCDSDNHLESEFPHRVSMTHREFCGPILLSIKNQDSLHSCLKKFTSPQEIRGYQWPSTEFEDDNVERTMVTYQTTKFDSNSLPQYFIFQLQRFHFNTHTFKIEKVTGDMDIPYSLDMTNYLSSTEPCVDEMNKNNHIYLLKGVIMHEGETTCDGHYFAMIRENEIGDESSFQNWKIYNDEDVKEILLTDCSGFKTSSETSDEKGENCEEQVPLQYSNPIILLYARTRVIDT